MNAITAKQIEDLAHGIVLIRLEQDRRTAIANGTPEDEAGSFSLLSLLPAEELEADLIVKAQRIRELAA